MVSDTIVAVDLCARVGATGLIEPGRPVVVLASGGQDSTALLHVAVRLDARVCALHVNYGLRGAASDADEAVLAATCERLGVPLDVERASAPAGGNLQAWARDVRYAHGARAAAARDALLATAHTRTDEAETILYRLATSPGRRALLGMEVRRGLLVRPLLAADATREETAGYCAQHGLAFADDASNADERFARTRVRHGLLAALRAVDDRAEANVVRTAELLRDEAEVLDVVVQTALAGRDRIEQAKLAALPPALARLVVRRLAEQATGTLCPRAAHRLPDVLALEQGALDLGDGARAVVERGLVRMTRTPPLP